MVKSSLLRKIPVVLAFLQKNHSSEGLLYILYRLLFVIVYYELSAVFLEELTFN